MFKEMDKNELRSLMLNDSTVDMYWLYFIYFEEM